jgi:hypothetical protein
MNPNAASPRIEDPSKLSLTRDRGSIQSQPYSGTRDPSKISIISLTSGYMIHPKSISLLQWIHPHFLNKGSVQPQPQSGREYSFEQSHPCIENPSIINLTTWKRSSSKSSSLRNKDPSHISLTLGFKKNCDFTLLAKNLPMFQDATE